MTFLVSIWHVYTLYTASLGVANKKSRRCGEEEPIVSFSELSCATV